MMIHQHYSLKNICQECKKKNKSPNAIMRLISWFRNRREGT